MITASNPFQLTTKSPYTNPIEGLYQNGRFNIHLWRSILKELIDKIDQNKIGLQIISPFGFEVMENDRFLESSLRRFYCYIGVPVAHFEMAKKITILFEKTLMRFLANKYPDFHEDIVLKIIQDNFIKLSHPIINVN